MTERKEKKSRLEKLLARMFFVAMLYQLIFLVAFTAVVLCLTTVASYWFS